MKYDWIRFKKADGVCELEETSRDTLHTGKQSPEG